MSNKNNHFPWQKPIISVQSYGKGIYLPQLWVSFFANCSNVSPGLPCLMKNRPAWLTFCKQCRELRFIYMHLWRRLGIVQASLASALALRKRLDNFARFFVSSPARQPPKPHARKHFLYAFFYPEKPFSLSFLFLFNYISNIYGWMVWGANLS